MSFLFKTIESLPVPPLEIRNKIDLNYRPETNQLGAYRTRYLMNWGRTGYEAAKNLRIIYPEFEQWVKNLIPQAIVDAGINYVNIDPTIDKGPISTGAHTDKVRNFALLFPILQGGSDARLTFWQEHGHDIYRSRNIDAVDRSKLTLLDQVVLSDSSWLLISTRVLHSVENLYSTRINLQISFEDNPWDHDNAIKKSSGHYSR